jgi:4-amino-4-deoxy-L-arabinose transferase-like glycosyltransferase
MTRSQTLWLIFAAALAIRAGYTLGFYLFMGADSLLAEDSILYVELARIFFSEGDFLREAGIGGRFEPETERMPLYVIWLGLHQLVSGTPGPLFPALTQGVLDALACVLIARTAMLLSPRLLLPAGLFAACNPTQIIVGAMILTDSLFFFFVCLMLFAAVHWLRQPAWRWALLLGLALGLGVSTRVMLLPAVVGLAIMLPLAALWLRRMRFVGIAHVLVFVAICAALQAPILARNISQYDSVQLTSQGGTHALLWLAPLVLEAVDGTPHAEGARRMQRRYETEIGGVESENPFTRSAQMSATARRAITELGAIATVKAWLIGGAINLFSPAAILSPPVSNLPRTGFYDIPGDSKLDKLWTFMFHNDNPAYAWVLIVTFLSLLAVRAGQLMGLGFGLFQRQPDQTDSGRREVRVVLLLLLLWTLYILVVNGPIASPKYRLPIEPFGAICGAYALIAVGDWLRRRAARRQAR